MLANNAQYYSPNHAPDEAWKDFAACRNVPKSVFFPTRKSDEAKALAICDTCEVRTNCIEYSEQIDTLGHGVYGRPEKARKHHKPPLNSSA